MSAKLIEETIYHTYKFESIQEMEKWIGNMECKGWKLEKASYVKLEAVFRKI